MSSISMLSGITRGRATSCCFRGIRSATARGRCGAASDWASALLSSRGGVIEHPVPTEALRRFNFLTIRDLSGYFSALGISSVPKVTAVSVDHGKNHPTGDPNGPDGEVMLDIEVVGAIAPQANIAVYFAPNTDAGFLDAITTAIHDTTHKP